MAPAHPAHPAPRQVGLEAAELVRPVSGWWGRWACPAVAAAGHASSAA